MVVFVMENATEGLRGEITRWFLEVKAGVFVGHVAASVRDVMWKKIQNEIGAGAAVMIHSAANEQGFTMEMCHDPKRSIVDFDGIQLIKRNTD